jgi:hypothetical protein
LDAAACVKDDSDEPMQATAQFTDTKCMLRLRVVILKFYGKFANNIFTKVHGICFFLFLFFFFFFVALLMGNDLWNKILQSMSYSV